MGAWVCSLLLILCACQAVRQGRESTGETSPIVPFQMFDHKSHARDLPADAFRCDACHLQQAGRNTGELSLSGRDSCHDCHVVNQRNGKAHLKCRDCHLDRQRIKPPDHIADWGATHGASVSSSRVAYSERHTGRFCADCHSK